LAWTANIVHDFIAFHLPPDFIKYAKTEEGLKHQQ
jgi:hypothetical protein